MLEQEFILADLILIVHFSFILIVIFGGFFVYRKPFLAWLHIPMIFWAALVSLKGWVCPLTPLENYYRNIAGNAEYETGFIEHYLAPLIYPGFMDSNWGVILGISVIIWNLLMYSFILKKYFKSND